MRRYKTVRVPRRKMTAYGKMDRRRKNAGKRRDMACGFIGLICVGIGAGAGGWGGAAIGAIIGGAIISWVCTTPNI